MTIKKGDKEYIVTELKGNWKLSRKVGVLTIEYAVPKDICKDETELTAYVEQEDIF